MNPKDGTACKAEAPVEPAEPEEATASDPGEKPESPAGSGSESSSSAASGGESEKKKDEEITWVALELKDKDGKPVPNESYEVKLADGSVRTGKLDKDGKARLAGVKPGSCEVRFPKIDKKEWKKA
ncbi:MAG TPA: carboxypeptidase-like regulatory domain-containing protein [Verrucomicrobiae bacterium]|nr:carboxypeptidase-like regulatory domain-containing protein [Verrucomicrobiae bacterium]